MSETTLYVVEQSRFGDNVGGCLATPDEVIRGHMSSSPSWLQADLTRNFGRDVELRERFGEHRVVYVSLDDELPPEIEHHFGSDPATSPASCGQETAEADGSDR